MKEKIKELLFQAKYLSMMRCDSDDQAERLAESYEGKLSFFPCKLEKPFFAVVIRNNFPLVVEAKVYKYECDIAGIRVYICETKNPKERWNMSGKDFDAWPRYETEKEAKAALETT